MAEDKVFRIWPILPTVSSFSGGAKNIFVFNTAADEQNAFPSFDFSHLTIRNIESKGYLTPFSGGYYKSFLKSFFTRTTFRQDREYTSRNEAMGTEHLNDRRGFPKIAKINHEVGWKESARRGNYPANNLNVHKYIGSFNDFGSSLLSNKDQALHSANTDQNLGIGGQFASIRRQILIRFPLGSLLFPIIFGGTLCFLGWKYLYDERAIIGSSLIACGGLLMIGGFLLCLL